MDAPQPSPPTPAATRRGAHTALGVFLLLLLCLLALRGYGNGLGAKPTERSTAAPTDLNRAERAELEQIPGVGPGLARQIDDHRRAKGPFKSVDELRQVNGIGQATLDKVRPFLRVQGYTSEPQSFEPLVLERKPASPAPKTGDAGNKLRPGDPPIDVNAAGLAELMRIPGIGPVTAQNILVARGEKRFASVADLDRAKGIGPKTLEKIRPFVFVK